MSEEFEAFIKSQDIKDLQAFIKKQRLTKDVQPAPHLVLNALKITDYHTLKVVILGCAPYNDMGIAYSSTGQNTTRELLEIQNEIRRSLYSYPFKSDTVLFKTNNLTQWVEQGVLMINSVWTRDDEPHKGWEAFTGNLIQMLNKHHNDLVFMFWGTENYSKGIDGRHLVLTSPPPGSGKFYGCGHFAKCNEFIRTRYKNLKAPIDWHLLK